MLMCTGLIGLYVACVSSLYVFSCEDEFPGLIGAHSEGKLCCSCKLLNSFVGVVVLFVRFPREAHGDTIVSVVGIDLIVCNILRYKTKIKNSLDGFHLAVTCVNSVGRCKDRLNTALDVDAPSYIVYTLYVGDFKVAVFAVYPQYRGTCKEKDKSKHDEEHRFFGSFHTVSSNFFICSAKL